MKCEKCGGGREGTVTWVGEGGWMECAHGMSAQWCLRCVRTAQLAHARKMQAQIPALERDLAEGGGGAQRRGEQS